MLKNVLSRIWPNLDRVWVGNDLESSLARLPGKEYLIRCVAISGTGSCCYGTDGEHYRKTGGYGHVIGMCDTLLSCLLINYNVCIILFWSGDRGSGYAIAYNALRLALYDYEHNYDDSEAYTNGTANGTKHVENFDLEESASSTPLLKLLLSHLNMSYITELVSWSLVASKKEMADLARIVIRAAHSGNEVAKSVIEKATNEMANDITCLVSKVSATILFYV